MKMRAAILFCFLSCFSFNVLADGGACATKPDFDPMQTYCYLYKDQKTCDAWWEICTWIPDSTTSCKAQTSGMESYCASIADQSTCQAHRDCDWH